MNAITDTGAESHSSESSNKKLKAPVVKAAVKLDMDEKNMSMAPGNRSELLNDDNHMQTVNFVLD